MNISAEQLQLIGAIRRAGSLAKAARELGVTPSAVSQQIAKIEALIGAQLVRRNNQGATLSPLGNVLAQHAAKVAAALQEADESIRRSTRDHARRLRTGAFTSVATTVLPDMLAALKLRHPDAVLSVSELPSDAGPEMVASGELDVALGAVYGSSTTAVPQVEHVHLFADSMKLILPDDHPLAVDDGTPVPLEKLRGESWACSMQSRPARRQIEKLAGLAGIEMEIPFQTESYDVVLGLVSVGVAVGLVPATAVRDVPGVVVVDCEPTATRDVYAAVPSSRGHIPLADELLSLLSQHWSAQANT